MMIDMFMTLIHISSHQSLTCLTYFNIIIEMFMTLIAIRYSPHGMIFFDQFNMTPMVLGWGCTGMVLWRNITIFLILNSYAECICIHTNNTYIYIYIYMLQITWIAGCPEFSCALGMSRR